MTVFIPMALYVKFNYTSLWLKCTLSAFSLIHSPDPQHQIFMFNLCCDANLKTRENMPRSDFLLCAPYLLVKSVKSL